MIHVLFTGGTISMRHDAALGGAVPSLSAEEIVAATRGIEEVAEIVVEQWGRFPGPHMTVERMWALRGRIAELAADPGVDGVVVTHGTDTLEESAYLSARSLPADKPVVFTGAMRNASDLGWDGPREPHRRRARGGERGGARLRRDGGDGLTRVRGARRHQGAHPPARRLREPRASAPSAWWTTGRVIFRRALPPAPPILAPATPAVAGGHRLRVRRVRRPSRGRRRATARGSWWARWAAATCRRRWPTRSAPGSTRGSRW
jgi:L-asparaginase